MWLLLTGSDFLIKQGAVNYGMFPKEKRTASACMGVFALTNQNRGLH